MSEKDLQRFMRFVQVNPVTGCWLWTGAKNTLGYARFWFRGKNVRAHRLSYQHFKGEIEKNLEVDHLCQNESCVNPEHLEVVTGLENLKRKWAVANMQKLVAIYFVHPVRAAA